jgi:hypothetical protein
MFSLFVLKYYNTQGENISLICYLTEKEKGKRKANKSLCKTYFHLPLHISGLEYLRKKQNEDK